MSSYSLGKDMSADMVVDDSIHHGPCSVRRSMGPLQRSLLGGYRLNSRSPLAPFLV